MPIIRFSIEDENGTILTNPHNSTPHAFRRSVEQTIIDSINSFLPRTQYTNAGDLMEQILFQYYIDHIASGEELERRLQETKAAYMAEITQQFGERL